MKRIFVAVTMVFAVAQLVYFFTSTTYAQAAESYCYPVCQQPGSCKAVESKGLLFQFDRYGRDNAKNVSFAALTLVNKRDKPIILRARNADQIVDDEMAVQIGAYSVRLGSQAEIELLPNEPIRMAMEFDGKTHGDLNLTLSLMDITRKESPQRIKAVFYGIQPIDHPKEQGK